MFIQQHKQLIEAYLMRMLPLKSSNSLYAAMQYSVLNNGKRLRPILVYATGAALGVNIHALDAAAAAVELMHCYSLVHDDLPAMDDDDLRRGLPTCHKAFDEATAILAGDALQTLAFQILSDSELNLVSTEQQVAMINALSKAAGCNGMVLGQNMDLNAENCTLKLSELTKLHECKTGAMFVVCVELALIAATDGNFEHNQYTNSLLKFAQHLGLAFQIQDDILDVSGDSSIIGKAVGADAKLNKSTFVQLLGLDEAKKQVANNFACAGEALAPLNANGDILRALITDLIERRY